MDIGLKVTQPYYLIKDVKRLGIHARQDSKPCDSHPSDMLYIDVFYTSDSPREYDSAATDKRWRLEKRQ